MGCDSPHFLWWLLSFAMHDKTILNLYEEFYRIISPHQVDLTIIIIWSSLFLPTLYLLDYTSSRLGETPSGQWFSVRSNSLTHWGRATHICVSKLTITGSDNGLSPGRLQAIIWTNAGILLIGPLGINFSENSIEILTLSFTKMRLKVSSAK